MSPFNNPIGSAKIDSVLGLLELPPDGRAIDAGCGMGELLLRAAGRHGVQGLGLDHDSKCIAIAQANANARGLASRCQFIFEDARLFTAEPGTFDLAICVGSTHAFGMSEAAYPNTIERLQKLVKPGGYVLIGESYWRKTPAAEYLALIGEPVGIYRDHAENISFAEARGLMLLYATVASEDEWDDFEWRHYLNIRSKADSNPNDAALARRLARALQWRDGYLRWGRNTMGFGLYLFRAGASHAKSVEE